MSTFTRILFLVSPLFLLTSCFSFHADVVIGGDGKIRAATVIDMSKMAALAASFSTGSTSSGALNINLCDDKNFSEGLNEGKEGNEVVKCTNMGDYRAKIETESTVGDNPAILMMSGVTIIDALHVDENSESAKSEISSDISPEDMGFSVTESLTLPGTIVYKDAGKLTGTGTIFLNLLDPKVLKKREVFVIATQDGKKLKPAQIARYKVLLRKQIRMAKRK